MKKVIIIVFIVVIVFSLVGCDSNKDREMTNTDQRLMGAAVSLYVAFPNNIISKTLYDKTLSKYFPDEKYFYDIQNKLTNALNKKENNQIVNLFSEDVKAHKNFKKGLHYLSSTWDSESLPIVTHIAVDFFILPFVNTSTNYSQKLKILDGGIKVELNGESYNLWIRAIRTDAPKDKIGVFALYLFKDGAKPPKSWYEYNVYQPVGIYVPEDFEAR